MARIGLSYHEWDETEEDMVDGLEGCTIVHRKPPKDGRMEYTIMNDKKESLKVVLDGLTDETCDPLEGIHACRMKLDESRTVVLAFSVNDTTYCRR